MVSAAGVEAVRVCSSCFVSGVPDDAANCTNPNCRAPMQTKIATKALEPRAPGQLARRGGPGTSAEAARGVSATLGKRQQRALNAVAADPGRTARELSRTIGDDDPRSINRRLNEIEQAGLVERRGPRACSITGKKCATWWLKGTSQ